MKVVVTGFQPFGKEEMNPSFEAVRLLPDEICGAQIVKEEIPVVFRKGGKTVHEIVRRENPDIVILVGQAGGRTSMNVERVAINCEDCPSGFPDNEGKKMRDNGVPASVSNTAGTYVCNDLMYHLLYQLAHEFPNTRGGFIHVPYATIQNHPNMASMTIAEISKGLKLAIEAAIENEQDIAAAGGATH